MRITTGLEDESLPREQSEVAMMRELISCGRAMNRQLQHHSALPVVSRRGRTVVSPQSLVSLRAATGRRGTAGSGHTQSWCLSSLRGHISEEGGLLLGNCCHCSTQNLLCCSLTERHNHFVCPTKKNPINIYDFFAVLSDMFCNLT